MRRRWGAFLAITVMAACGRSGFEPVAGGGTTGTPTGTPTGSGTATPPGAWWDNAYLRRMPVIVTAGSTNVPADYSVEVVFDHASLVSSSLSLASGDDVALVADDGTELDRVLDTGSAWNNAKTALWFRAPAALAAGATARYWIYFDDPGAGSPMADPANVFLYFDDFEGGSLSNWSALPAAGYWALDGTQHHRGTNALHAPGVGGSSKWLALATAPTATDVAVDAWWWLDQDGEDIAQTVRTTPATDDFESNVVRSCFFFFCNGGFNLAKNTGGNYFNIDGAHGNVSPRTWTRVTVEIVGQQMRVLKNLAQVEPVGGWMDAGADHPAGSVGLRSFNLGGAGWWIDDFTVRPLVDPEPAAAPGPIEIMP